ncbi:DUF2017 family protein [Microbacterium sp. B2969]|uniref:DUF2017 family protein n=1 Tax=Microbacterium alkaliflavum TaxID=3248839 RepID=A0ABW7Q5P4_9MICO
MTPRIVILELTKIEAMHLAGLVTQFTELLEESAGESRPSDPAVERLVPDAYGDDSEASEEFRSLTQRELLERRSMDAATVLADLHDVVGLDADDIVPEALESTGSIRLDAEGLQAWLRTLAAVRLVLASRLGISDEHDHVDDDPRFGIYDWLGYRLEGLVTAADDSL